MCAKIPYKITMWAIWVQTWALRIFPLAGDDDDAGQRYLDQDVDLDYQDHGDGGQRDLDQDVDLDDHDNHVQDHHDWHGVYVNGIPSQYREKEDYSSPFS